MTCEERPLSVLLTEELFSVTRLDESVGAVFKAVGFRSDFEVPLRTRSGATDFFDPIVARPLVRLGTCASAGPCQQWAAFLSVYSSVSLVLPI